jgi:hypothetical protein
MVWYGMVATKGVWSTMLNLKVQPSLVSPSTGASAFPWVFPWNGKRTIKETIPIISLERLQTVLFP